MNQKKKKTNYKACKIGGWKLWFGELIKLLQHHDLEDVGYQMNLWAMLAVC